MACIVDRRDIEWMLKKQPEMCYINSHHAFAGTFSFSAQYRDLELISDHYKLAILCNEFPNSPLPAVCETEGRIVQMIKLLGIDMADLHVNGDGSLCIIRPDKFQLWYPNGFDIKIFERNIATHLYWLSYRERYGKEPWPGEEHGGIYSFD